MQQCSGLESIAQSFLIRSLVLHDRSCPDRIGTSWLKQAGSVSAWLAAPEILRGGCAYNSACDVWSLGCLLYVMVFGDYPFLCDSERLDERAKFSRTQDR